MFPNVPVGQLLHTVRPVRLENVPGPHGVHALEEFAPEMLLKVPAGHALHPVWFKNVPASH